MAISLLAPGLTKPVGCSAAEDWLRHLADAIQSSVLRLN